MKFLKWLLGGILAIIVLAVGIAFLLPREVTLQRSVEINAPAAEIFPYFNSMAETQKWSPWLELDPDVKVTFSGPETGVGNRMEWESDVQNVGSGSQEITASTPDKRVETALDFGPQGTATAWFDLTEAGEVTTVVWGFNTDLGMNPMARWFGLMFEGLIGPSYEKGLANLKELAEG